MANWNFKAAADARVERAKKKASDDRAAAEARSKEAHIMAENLRSYLSQHRQSEKVNVEVEGDVVAIYRVGRHFRVGVLSRTVFRTDGDTIDARQVMEEVLDFLDQPLDTPATISPETD